MPGDNNDFQGTGGVISITPDGPTVTIMIDGNNFQVNPSEIRQWIIAHGATNRQVVWNPSPTTAQQGPRPGNGEYQWERYRVEDGSDDQHREALNEEQSQAWQRMLDAWGLFQQQIQQLGALTDGDAIIGKVGDAIAALDMIEFHDWGAPYTDEFGGWVVLSAAAYTPASLQAAAQAVVTAGNTLYGQWHAAIDAGNYDSYSLYDQQHAFAAACTQARSSLVAAGN
jgi:hypothetical protein